MVSRPSFLRYFVLAGPTRGKSEILLDKLSMKLKLGFHLAGQHRAGQDN